jgi:hypothetical protein
MILIFIFILILIICIPKQGSGEKLKTIRKLIKQIEHHMKTKEERVKIVWKISCIIMMLIRVKSYCVSDKLFKKKNKYNYLDEYSGYGDNYIYCIFDPICTGYIGKNCLLTQKQINTLADFFEKELGIKKKDYILKLSLKI